MFSGWGEALSRPRTVAGGRKEQALQPLWAPASQALFISFLYFL